jgi:hypothetical protein
MKSIRTTAIVSAGLVLMLLGDAPPESPLPFQIVSEAHAILGVWRRAARRTVIVGSAVVATDAAAASASAAAAQSQAAAAQKQAAAAEQQAAAAQHAAPAPPTPPAAGGAPLPMGTVVSALPGGCTSTPVGGVEYYYCGGNFYRAMFQGNNLVYVTAQPK